MEAIVKDILAKKEADHWDVKYGDYYLHKIMLVGAAHPSRVTELTEAEIKTLVCYLYFQHAIPETLQGCFELVHALQVIGMKGEKAVKHFNYHLLTALLNGEDERGEQLYNILLPQLSPDDARAIVLAFEQELFVHNFVRTWPRVIPKPVLKTPDLAFLLNLYREDGLKVYMDGGVVEAIKHLSDEGDIETCVEQFVDTQVTNFNKGPWKRFFSDSLVTNDIVTNDSVHFCILVHLLRSKLIKSKLAIFKRAFLSQPQKGEKNWMEMVIVNDLQFGMIPIDEDEQEANFKEFCDFYSLDITDLASIDAFFDKHNFPFAAVVRDFSESK